MYPLQVRRLGVVCMDVESSHTLGKAKEYIYLQRRGEAVPVTGRMHGGTGHVPESFQELRKEDLPYA